MAQNRENEDRELKIPDTLSVCTQSIQLAPPPPVSGISPADDPQPQEADPKISDLNCARSEDRSDLLCSEEKAVGLCQNNKKTLKRGREKEGNRCSCSGCKKKLGLMGFRCRCGEVFCPEHRYSDRHNCSYDYKAAGREAIARENPVVRAAKILKV